jgi:hypothetical protein
VAFVEKLGAKPRRIASPYVGRLEGERLPERQAIDQALHAGMVQRAVIRRLGLPERPSIRARTDARVAFFLALRRVKAAA